LRSLTGIFKAAITAKNQYQWPTHQSAGWAAVAMVWLFVIHFGYSWGPCAWIVISEIWPLSNRSYGIALGASSNWYVVTLQNERSSQNSTMPEETNVLLPLLLG